MRRIYILKGTIISPEHEILKHRIYKLRHPVKHVMREKRHRHPGYWLESPVAPYRARPSGVKTGLAKGLPFYLYPHIYNIICCTLLEDALIQTKNKEI